MIRLLLDWQGGCLITVFATLRWMSNFFFCWETFNGKIIQTIYSTINFPLPSDARFGVLCANAFSITENCHSLAFHNILPSAVNEFYFMKIYTSRGDIDWAIIHSITFKLILIAQERCKYLLLKNSFFTFAGPMLSESLIKVFDRCNKRHELFNTV